MSEQPETTAKEKVEFYLAQANLATAEANKAEERNVREAFLQIAHCWMDLAIAVDGADQRKH